MNLLPFHLNKARTQLNTDLLGVILTLLKLLVKAFCLDSIFLLAQGKAFQGHSCIIYIQLVCFVGLGPEVLLCAGLFTLVHFSSWLSIRRPKDG